MTGHVQLCILTSSHHMTGHVQLCILTSSHHMTGHVQLCMSSSLSLLPHSEGMTSSSSCFGEKEVERLLDLLHAYSGI